MSYGGTRIPPHNRKGACRKLSTYGCARRISTRRAFLTFIETNPDTGRDIGLLSLADNTTRDLFATEFTEEGPAVSSDGRLIAFSSTESDRSEVVRQSVPERRGESLADLSPWRGLSRLVPGRHRALLPERRRDDGGGHPPRPNLRVGRT